MRSLIHAGAAALALATLPAALGAQDAQPAPSSAAESNAQATTPPPTVETVPPARPGEPATVVTNHPGNLAPPPAASLNKTYPVCTRTLQDNCRNPGEGGARRG